MKEKKIILIVVTIIITVVYVFWKNVSVDPNKTKINDDVFLVKENGTYNIYCKQNTYGLKRSYDVQEKIASNVDSIIISYKYGTLFHGFNNSNNNYEWFYIDVSSVKNVHEGFISVVDATSSTIGEVYLDSIMTADETWNKYN
ncbi:MAG: hypothetical protein RQ875_00755 [Vicingaceae bacterium]|nr:hypothetical protein [Vicingaceae bacterium]